MMACPKCYIDQLESQLGIAQDEMESLRASQDRLISRVNEVEASDEETDDSPPPSPGDLTFTQPPTKKPKVQVDLTVSPIATKMPTVEEDTTDLPPTQPAADSPPNSVSSN